jgi:cysteine desulfurase
VLASERHWLNASSPYRAGAAVHVRLEAARERLAGWFGLDPQRVVFNSGATEGNNSVFAHWAETLAGDAQVAVSATEHPSVIEAAKKYFPDRIQWLTPNAAGAVEVAAIDWSGIAALSVMAANNETGALNPWVALARLSREAEVSFHCDASQWIGKLPLDGFAGCDFVTGCAHKFGGPKGVGFLVVPDLGGQSASLVGGAQEQGRRAGTEDLPGILAMVAALEVCEGKRASVSSGARERFVRRLQESLPGVTATLIPGGEVLWNTVSVIMPRFKSSRWIRALEKRSFLVSAGSACSSGKAGPSHVLAAMGLEPEVADRVLRISAGWETREADWEALLDALLASYEELQAETAASTAQVISI